MLKRKRTRVITVGNVNVGGKAPISIQSMTNTDTRDVRATLRQIRRLERAGCDIVRLAVVDEKAGDALSEIVNKTRIPVIADIHFNYRLALQSMHAGVHGIRINPGNIGGRKRLLEVVKCAAEKGVAIRIGINAGSLEKDILKRHGHPTADALVESTLRNIAYVEETGFKNYKVSMKSSDVSISIDAYRLISKKVRCPLHLGITEAGTAFSGTIKSSIGLGILLMDGIGDTLRVSLSADPVEEVRVGFEILKCLGLRDSGPTLISCPTCGRKQIDVISLAQKVEKRIAGIKAPIKIAVMGCEVNGPGEAKEADIGIAGSKNNGIIFKKGTIIKRCSKDELMDVFLNEVETFDE